MVLYWTEEVWRPRGWLSVLASRLIVPRTNIGFQMGISSDGESVAEHVVGWCSIVMTKWLLQRKGTNPDAIWILSHRSFLEEVMVQSSLIDKICCRWFFSEYDWILTTKRSSFWPNQRYSLVVSILKMWNIRMKIFWIKEELPLRNSGTSLLPMIRRYSRTVIPYSDTPKYRRTYACSHIQKVDILVVSSIFGGPPRSWTPPILNDFAWSRWCSD